ncbi:MAG: hypothetical protein QOH66_2724 [Actinomycetota bacterium]|nr:hypothetical protein [Actinomycetota bacterium]
MNERLQRIVKATTATAVMAATALAMTGTAHATTYPVNGTAYSGTSSGVMTDGNTGTPAPTQNLANLSRDLYTASQGVSAAVHFHAGQVTGGSSVAMSVKWGSVAQTSGYYNNASGSRFAFNFPAGDGSQRWEVVNVTMTERTSTGRTYTYTAGRSVPIHAVWDVQFSPLNFKLLSDCAWIGDSNFDLYFTQTGVQGEVSFGLGSGQTHTVSEFGRTWNQVTTSNDLRMGSVSFYNTDFHWSGAYLEGYPAASSQQVLPAANGSRAVTWNQNDVMNNCSAQLSYTVTTWIHTYSV